MRLAAPLESDGLTLKPLSTEHACGAYLKWLNDSDVTRFLVPTGGRVTPEHLRRYIAENQDDPSALLAGIFVEDGRRHIGNIRLSAIHRGHLRASVGLMIGEREMWGRGHASEAIRAITSYAHDALSLDYIYAGCHEDNGGSIKAFRNAGYMDFATASTSLRCLPALREGIFIDHVMMVHCRA